jgi:hypothetical protein
MKRRQLLSAWALSLGVVGAVTTVAACADDESPSAPGADAAVIPTPADASVDAVDEADAAEAALPCTDDVPCPFGPFEANTEGGPLDLRTRINAIRARNVSDVWLAGANGTIAHYDGVSWRRSDSGSQQTMKSLWLRDEDEVALVDLKSVYRRNFDAADAGVDAGLPSADGWSAVGMALVPTEASSSSLIVSSTWAAPGAEWAWLTTLEYAANGTPRNRVNGIWRLRIAPETSQLELQNGLPPGTCMTIGCRRMTSVHGRSADDLWSVGYTGAIVHITGAQSAVPEYKPFDSQTWAELDGVWAASETEAWAVGGGGVIRHYTGHPYAWDIVDDVPTTETLRAVWGSSPSDVWAVGDTATVLHYDGTSWSRVAVAGLGLRHPDLFAVWTPAPGHVWIAGDGVFLSLGGKP